MKFKNESQIVPGTRVVFNELPDATVFEVTRKEGPYAIWVREAGTTYAEQRNDASLCHKPTAQQLGNAKVTT